ncbi:MAG: helix-turn-helix domain-containing protein [Pedobacter sp.]
MHRFEQEGVEGLKDRKGRGRRSALSHMQLDRVKVLVLKEAPAKYGFQSEKWTGPLLAQWIKTEYGLQYQKAQIDSLLEKVGIAFEKKAGLIAKV